ncbi:hypothetical protein Syun_006252 [Stephania yunnanensis]|uniref:Uncharacterized protein n=1 Tax=Stephania yunnanensis TaxID=152371 RepID=A0AAP0Q164_9MAGN
MAASDPPPHPFNSLAPLHHHCHHYCFDHHPLFTISPHWFPIPNYHLHIHPPFAPLHIPLLPNNSTHNQDLVVSEIKQSLSTEDTQLVEEGFEEEVEEDDGEPVFVMTDEWVEFFAKSEAKRKLEKKLAKKNKRKSIE